MALPPKWVTKLGPHQFPYGPRRVYHYLCHFMSCECFLYNCMLAKEFGVGKRTMERYIAWLRSHALVSLSLRSDKSRPLNDHSFKTIRRIYVQHYPTPEAWLVALATYRLTKIARKKRSTPTQKNAWSDLTPAQKEARRQQQIKALFALKAHDKVGVQ